MQLASFSKNRLDAVGCADRVREKIADVEAV